MVMTMGVVDPKVRVQREPRRQLRNRVTWISFGDSEAKRECTVLDVSPGGAKIMTDVAIDVRDRFGLTLTPEHAGRYECEVVWRRGKTYGVKFLQ
ncbi:MAG: PilZ domain-containing protein [Bradyrhizobium sp.]